ncbi:MAG: phosphonate C-P lyase system protein PhnH [Rhodospirillales bacterium]|nr:phosphonate C-P lyase system protein PhnH [Rhodospirillales bacterium]
MSFVPAAGFADPVTDANASFRAVLNAMAHPGRLFSITAQPPAPPVLGCGLGSILLALADRDTPLWLSETIAVPEVAGWIGFHTGAQLIGDHRMASFVLFHAQDRLLPLDEFSLGTPEYPDRSATLLIGVERLQEGKGLTLSGPGIERANRLDIEGIGPEFWQARADLAPLYPLGLDLIFCTQNQVAALPRTTVVEA